MYLAEVGIEERSQEASRRVFRTAMIIAVLLAVAISIASWVHTDLATNDFERFDDLRLTYAFFVLLAAAAGGYVALVEQPAAPDKGRVQLALVAMGLPLIAAFPVGSRDVFAYAFYPKMWAAYGINPYLKPPSTVSHDEWFPLLQAWWKDHPTAYGPLFTLQARAVYAIAGHSLAAVIAVYKLINLPLLLLSGWLLVRLRRETFAASNGDSNDRVFMLWLWCPLVLFESLVSGHNDLAMVVLIQAAVLAWVRGNWLATGALLAASFWYKLYSVVLLPVWFVWWLRRSGRATIPQIGMAVAGAVVVSLAAIAPFWSDLGAILTSLRGHEVARLMFPTEMPPPVWVLFQVLDLSGIFDTDVGPRLFNILRLSVFAAGLLWILVRRRRAAYSAAAFVDDCFLTLVLFVSVVPTLLYPWHLLALPPLALAAGGHGHQRAVALITVTALLSYFLTFVWALVLCVLVVGALAAMRRRR